MVSFSMLISSAMPPTTPATGDSIIASVYALSFGRICVRNNVQSNGSTNDFANASAESNDALRYAVQTFFGTLDSVIPIWCIVICVSSMLDVMSTVCSAQSARARIDAAMPFILCANKCDYKYFFILSIVLQNINIRYESDVRG